MHNGTVTTGATVVGVAAGATLDKNDRGRGAMLGGTAGNALGDAFSKNHDEKKDGRENDRAKERQKSEPQFKIPTLPSSSPFPGIFQ